MRKILLALGCGLLPLAGWSEPLQPVLNEVIYPLRVEQWVTTKTAEVVVNVHATLNEDQLAKARVGIEQKLNRLAKTDWHITQFNRIANDSGLEQLVVQAQARLGESALADLRTQAKAISKPGETFTIQSINYEPTLAEMEATRSTLRLQVYQQVQQELTQLNKIYPNQHYVVHRIDFNEEMSPQPMPRAKIMLASVAENGGSAAAPLVVANKVIMMANIDLVSVNQ